MDAMAEKDPLTTSGSLLSAAMGEANSLTSQAVAAQERIKAPQAALTALDQGGGRRANSKKRPEASAGSTPRARPQNRYA